MRAIDADRLKEHIDKLPALPDGNFAGNHSALKALINMQPSVEPERKTGYCKECKYFEYNSVAKVDGIPLIVAHEICKRWGDGCKTSEDGYCFLYEPQESEECEK